MTHVGHGNIGSGGPRHVNPRPATTTIRSKYRRREIAPETNTSGFMVLADKLKRLAKKEPT